MDKLFEEEIKDKSIEEVENICSILEKKIKEIRFKNNPILVIEDMDKQFNEEYDYTYIYKGYEFRLKKYMYNTNKYNDVRDIGIKMNIFHNEKEIFIGEIRYFDDLLPFIEKINKE